MKINVKYFAAIREATGISEEVIDKNLSSVNELYELLNEKYNFSINKSDLKVAINEEYDFFESPLKDGDTVVFIPPVAGG